MYNMHRAAVRRIEEASPRAIEEYQRRYAITQEHKRVEREILALAHALNFPTEFDIWDETMPDVLQSDASGKRIFVGDAKNAIVEDAGDEATIDRIENYFKNVAALFDMNIIGSVVIVVGTNKPEVTPEWEARLNELAAKYRLVTGDGQPLTFHTTPLPSGRTWLINHIT